jgi:hypothetical protein
MAEGWDDPGCEAVAGQGRAGKAPKGPVMRLLEARNDKPPFGGLTRPVGSLYASIADERDGSLTDCSSSVNHPTTPNYSGTLVGKPTRRVTLNLHRGSQPVGTRRKSGSVNGTQGDES